MLPAVIFPWTVRWDNNTENTYRDEDLDFYKQTGGNKEVNIIEYIFQDKKPEPPKQVLYGEDDLKPGMIVVAKRNHHGLRGGVIQDDNTVVLRDLTDGECVCRGSVTGMLRYYTIVKVLKITQ